MGRIRKTKEARMEFMTELARMGISENVFSNWNNQRTEIPQSILKTEREFLLKYLKRECLMRYNIK